MKALAIRQPWAWLIVQGIKTVENRIWSTNFRGRFLVHASQKMDEVDPSTKRWLSQNRIAIPDDLPCGGIVGVATLVDCVAWERVNYRWQQRLRARMKGQRPGRRRPQVDSFWFDGPYGFILEDARPLPFKSWRGRLKFFNVPDDLYGDELKT
jgi:hypothetical protein